MEKRKFLATLGGRRSDLTSADAAFARFANSALPRRAPVPAGLELYDGPWEKPQAMHLLRRALFGFTQADLDRALSLNALSTVDALLAPAAPPGPPVVTDATREIDILPGATWVTAKFDGNLDFVRQRSLQSWWFGLLLNQGFSLQEKMVLFWHNNFATELDIIGDARYSYGQNALLRSFALGNFRELAKQITIDPGMLRYLNGNTNTKSNPNENYGRELQELFTIGKGDEIAAGNYTNYTEEDVKAASRVLTGWRDLRDTLNSEFRPTQHDAKDKVFSSAYGNTVIKGRADATGAQELDEMLDMIFAQKETARYLSRKLYRFFVYYNIDDQVEKDMIEPMANLLIQSKFEVKPVVEALLKSAHFHHALNVGCFIKTPLDVVVGSFRQFNVVFPDPSNDLIRLYGVWNTVQGEASRMLLEVGSPPNVAGWAAYYQDPVFYEAWISSDSLPRRVQLTDKLANARGYSITGGALIVDAIALAKRTSKAEDVTVLVKELAALLFPITVTAKQEEYLKDVMLDALPDYEWGVEWQAYLAAPTDTKKKAAVDNRLRLLIKAMMQMAEYQLC